MNDEEGLQVDRAYVIDGELQKLKASAIESFYRMGMLLKEVQEKEYWRTLGYDTFEGYLANPDIAIPTSSAYHAIGVVEVFPNFEEVKGLTVRNVINILAPIKKNKAPKEEMLEMAGALSTSDLEHELANRRLIRNRASFEQLPKIYPCRTCRKIKGAFWEDLCHCGLTEEQVKEITKLINKHYA